MVIEHISDANILDNLLVNSNNIEKTGNIYDNFTETELLTIYHYTGETVYDSYNIPKYISGSYYVINYSYDIRLMSPDIVNKTNTILSNYITQSSINAYYCNIINYNGEIINKGSYITPNNLYVYLSYNRTQHEC